MQQALSYGDALDVPFIYSSNGDGFLEHDNLTGKEIELKLEEFPSPEDLWERYKNHKNISKNESKIIEEDYFFDESGKIPRYYQRVAINALVSRISGTLNKYISCIA